MLKCARVAALHLSSLKPCRSNCKHQLAGPRPCWIHPRQGHTPEKVLNSAVTTLDVTREVLVLNYNGEV